jgi:hypothetical protein
VKYTLSFVVGLALCAAPVALAQQNPLGGGGQNPLAKKPAWVGTFSDGSVTLAVKQDGGDRFSGELTVGGQTYPVSGSQSGGTQLAGVFRVGEASFAFKATLAGDTMTLVSDGNTYTLAREQPKAPANPLGGGGGRAPAPASPAPHAGGGDASALGDVFGGAVTPFKQSQGWLTFGMPQGWGVQGEEPGTILFNPGYAQGGVLEAVVVGRYGDLDPSERGKSMADLLRNLGPAVQQELATEMGIQVSKSSEAREVTLNGQSGGCYDMEGVQSQDGTKVSVWLGGLVNGGRFFTVLAIVQQGKEAAYLPQAKRILASARVAAPKPGEQPAVSLAGHEFFRESTSGSGSFSTTYEFYQGGQVKKTSYFSAAGLGGGGATTEDTGNYTQAGNRVSMQFKDSQDQGTLEIQNGQLAGIRFGNALYRLRR